MEDDLRALECSIEDLADDLKYEINKLEEKLDLLWRVCLKEYIVFVKYEKKIIATFLNREDAEVWLKKQYTLNGKKFKKSSILSKYDTYKIVILEVPRGYSDVSMD